MAGFFMVAAFVLGMVAPWTTSLPTGAALALNAVVCAVAAYFAPDEL